MKVIQITSPYNSCSYSPVSGETLPSFIFIRILSMEDFVPFIFQFPPTKNFRSLTDITDNFEASDANQILIQFDNGRR